MVWKNGKEGEMESGERGDRKIWRMEKEERGKDEGDTHKGQ
jgi:hypothetical protein